MSEYPETQKIAVAIIHGVGNHQAGYDAGGMRKMKAALEAAFTALVGQPEQLAVEFVMWGPVLQERENLLNSWLDASGRHLSLNYVRRLFINFGVDALIYQPMPVRHGTDQYRNVYNEVHEKLAASLRTLAQQAGGTAPLCIIAHSLGTVIASNFIYDIQNEDFSRPADAHSLVAQEVRDAMHDEPTPVEKGETLAHLITLGSPIALWLLRLPRIDRPIRVPAPELMQHHPALSGEQTGWLNFYDRDDLVAYPLTPVPGYSGMVEDREVHVSGFLGRFFPWSHFGYWDDRIVVDGIAEQLAATWRALNPD